MSERHNIYVRATPLPNVRGRVDYISSEKRQEHLVAVHSSTQDDNFWRELSEHCQGAAAEAGHQRTREGRELMIALANELSEMDPNTLTRKISDKLKEMTGTENTVALHWNHGKKNFHCHAVFSENPEINEVRKGAILTRNTYYDANGKRSTKAACTDESGKLLKGCEFIPKGGQKIDVVRFGSKIEHLKSDEFNEEVKQAMADLQNDLLKEDRFVVYVDDGIHLKQQHIGNKVPKEIAEAIRDKNQNVQRYNDIVDELWDFSLQQGEDINATIAHQMQQNRETIKHFAGNHTKWNNAVIRIFERMRDYLRGLKDVVRRQAEKTAAERSKDKRVGLDESIDSARQKANLSPVEPHKKPREYERG